MQWLQIKVTFNAADIALTGDLIADIFYSFGTKGVVVDDPVFDTTADWGADAVPPPEIPAVTGYLPMDDRLNEHCTRLSERLAVLSASTDFQFDVTYQAIDEEDWAESWKAFFYPEKVSEKFVIKPTWRDYDAAPAEQVIEIDPGMAFGTGTHPTTALCIRLLEKHVGTGETVLDIGTGTGILLIAADKLGASRLTGVDLDPVAVDIARQNLLLNHVATTRFELYAGHLTKAVNQTYDVVVSNILADVILELLDLIPGVLKPGGRFICSGIIQAYGQKVMDKMAACGFEAIDLVSQGDWVALTGRLGNLQG